MRVSLASGGWRTSTCGRRIPDRQTPTTTTPRGNRVRYVQAAGLRVEDDEVLDPDARLALEVDPRLDREDRRRRERRVGGRSAERRQLVGREPDAVAEAVAEGRPAPVGRRSSPGPRGRSPARRAAARRVRPPRGRPAGRRPPRPGTRRPRRTPRGLAPSDRRRTASGSCRCGSRQPAPRSRRGARRPTSIGRLPGEPCGRAASGPARQVTSKARASAPPVRIRHSRSSASSFSVTPGRIDGSRDARARSATAHDAAATRSISDRLLRLPERLDPALDGHELHVRRRRGQALPRGVRDEPGLDGDALDAGFAPEVDGQRSASAW